MAKAKKLPSGSWRVQVYAGKSPEGKPKYISITCDTKDEAELAALEYRVRHKKEGRQKPENMTIRQAIDRYIESRDAVLSPSTIREYRQEQRNSLQGIIDVPLCKLTQDMIQREINIEARTKSPKTVRNIHGLLSAVLREYYPDLHLHTKLPQKTKAQIYIPDLDTISKIIATAKGTSLEIPIMLAVCLGLRRSEILGLKWSDVDLNAKTIHIGRAIVIGEKGKQVEKGTKTYAGDRTIRIPELLRISLQKQKDGHEGNEYIVPITGNTLYKRFIKMLSRNNLPRMKLHNLRHANASVMHLLNIPNKYAAERIGHSTDNMLKTVYQHTISQESEKINQIINDFFDKALGGTD